MDQNEINLDDLDASDVSSDWNSSEDEAPDMEVEDETTNIHGQNAPSMSYNQEIAEIEEMDGEQDPDVIPKTAHEIFADNVEVEEITLPTDYNIFLVRAGIVSHILDNSYIIDAGQNTKAVEENTIVFRKDLTPIGRIMEVFGQVEHPSYVLRWPRNMENPGLAVREEVFINNSTVHYILPAQLNSVGTDASNFYDEEPDDNERVIIECTEDVKGDEVVDESGIIDNPINYQQDFVIPSQKLQKPSNKFNKVYPTPAPFVSIPAPAPTPAPAPQPDTSGLDILRNSYF